MSKEQSVCDRVEQATADCIEWIADTFSACQDYVVDTYDNLPAYRIIRK
jgi:hypothetical protein